MNARMMSETILLSHATFGVLALLASVWVFVDTLNGSDQAMLRIRRASALVAALLWLTAVFGGYWYLSWYGTDKALIKAGPWPFAHTVAMETKEHVFFTLLLLGSYLPIVARDFRMRARRTRGLLLTISALIVALGLAMEGAGAIAALGVKLSLQA
jgi:hypothetical protein